MTDAHPAAAFAADGDVDDEYAGEEAGPADATPWTGGRESHIPRYSALSHMRAGFESASLGSETHVVDALRSTVYRGRYNAAW